MDAAAPAVIAGDRAVVKMKPDLMQQQSFNAVFIVEVLIIKK
jgi:hypothetical protein